MGSIGILDSTGYYHWQLGFNVYLDFIWSHEHISVNMFATNSLFDVFLTCFYNNVDSGQVDTELNVRRCYMY